MNFKSSPNLRFVIRTIVVSIAGYVATSAVTAFNNPRAFIGGLISAGITAAVGYLTPVEPSVGVKTDVDAIPSANTPADGAGK